MGSRLAVLARIVASAALVAGLGSAAVAQPRPSPAPSPSPGPAGFTAKAHANVSVVAQGQTFSGSVQLGVAQRESLVRVDILSIRSDTLPIPPITATIVVDHAARTITAWSAVTHTYHVQRFEMPRILAAASPSPSPRPSAAPRRTTPHPSFLRDLDVLSLTIKLIGHTMTAGLPTSGLALDFQVAKKGDHNPSHVTATTQLADDYALFPMTLDADVEPGAGGFSAKLGYAVDSLARGLPPASSFTVPAGYTESPTLLGVVFPRPSPSPSPSPSAAPH